MNCKVNQLDLSEVFEILETEAGKNGFSAFDCCTVDDFTEEDKQPVDFIIDNILPCGTTVLAAPPKSKKSFLALQAAISVSLGKPFLNRNTQKCKVVYFDLEGSKYRTNARSERMTNKLTNQVTFIYKTKHKLADDLPEQIKAMHKQDKETRFFIIDTFSRARGKVKAEGANAYDSDVALFEPIQQMAMEENIAILLVTHESKGGKGGIKSSDPFERINGSTGIGGSADCLWSLTTIGKRAEGKATLEINPRDAEGAELELVFSNMYLEWQVEEQIKSDIKGNAFCVWIFNHVPERRKEGVFYSYEDVFLQSFHCYSDKASDIIKEEIEKYKMELFTEYGIAIQTGVQSHSRRGIRIINVQ